MSLINSGLRQANHEDEEKEDANDITIIRQEKNERPVQQEPNYNEFSLFTNDPFSNTFSKPSKAIENEDENNFWLNIDNQASNDTRAQTMTDASAVCKTFAYSKF